MQTSLYKINWPPKPVIKPYKIVIVKTLEQLNDALHVFKENSMFSFDYETGPDKKTFATFKTIMQKYQKDLLALQEDYAIHMQMKVTATAKKQALKVLKNREKELSEAFEEEKVFFKESPFDPHRADICAVSMCGDLDTCYVAYFLDTGNSNFLQGEDLSVNEKRKAFFEILADRVFNDESIVKVAFNLEFESLHSLKHKCYISKPVFDPFIASVRCMQVVAWDEIIDAKKPSSGKGLKAQTLQYLGVEMTPFETVLVANNVEFFNQLSSDNESAAKYSAEDSIFSLYLANYWYDIARQIPIEKFNDGSPRVYTNYAEWLSDIEIPFMRVIGEMRYHGMTWDEKKCEEIYKQAIEKQEEITKEIGLICDRVCDKLVAKGLPEASISMFRNINAGKTGKTGIVRTLLFDIMGAPKAEMSKLTGDPSMDKEAMLDILFMVENNLLNLNEEKYLGMELPENFHMMNAAQINAHTIKTRKDSFFKQEMIDLLNAISDMQKYGTLISSHIEGRKKYKNPVTGRIHSSYTVWTETSRTNSSRPNGQNVPRFDNDPLKIRSLYRAAKGKILVLIDYSGFELRLMAWKANDQYMLKLLNEGGDLHKATACAMTGKKPEEITKHERSLAKAGNFGINYGGTEHSLQSTLKTMDMRVSLPDCLKIVNAIKKTYPGIPRFQQDIAIQARKLGFVDTIYGFKRVLKDINASRRDLRGSDERRAANTPIQGSAADIMKRAQNSIYDYIGKYKLHDSVNMIAQIHDEVIIEMDEDIPLKSAILKDIMEIMARPPFEGFPVAMPGDCSVTNAGWGDKVSLENWLKNG